MRRLFLSGVALFALMSAEAFAGDASGDVNDMIDQLAPKAETGPKPAAVLKPETATEQTIVDYLDASPSRAVGPAAAALKIPSPTSGHEPQILQAITGRPELQVAVNFQGESDALAPDAGDLLNTLGAALNNTRLAKQRFLIGVHTDLVGSDEYNRSVAGLRAKAIALALAERYGVTPARLETVGFGRLQSADTATGSQIRVVNLGAFATDAPTPGIVAIPAPVKPPVARKPHMATIAPWNPNAERQYAPKPARRAKVASNRPSLPSARHLRR